MWATFYAAVYVLSPFIWPGYLVSLYVFKAFTDRQSGIPFYLTMLAPLSYALGTILQFDSAVSHWTGRVSWKGLKPSA